MAPVMDFTNVLPRQYEGQCQLPETAHGTEHWYFLQF